MLRDVAPTPAPHHRLYHWKAWALGLGLLGLTVLIAPYLCGWYLRGGVEVVLEGVVFPPGASDPQPNEEPALWPRVKDTLAGLARGATGRDDITVRVRVKNHTVLSGALVSVSYAITVDDKKVGRGAWSPPGKGPLMLGSGEEIPLDLPIRLDPANTLVSVIRALKGQRSPIKVEGDVIMKIALGPFSIPFELRRVGLELSGGNQPTP